jgi:hypothetical protein
MATTNISEALLNKIQEANEAKKKKNKTPYNTQEFTARFNNFAAAKPDAITDVPDNYVDAAYNLIMHDVDTGSKALSYDDLWTVILQSANNADRMNVLTDKNSTKTALMAVCNQIVNPPKQNSAEKASSWINDVDSEKQRMMNDLNAAALDAIGNDDMDDIPNINTVTDDTQSSEDEIFNGLHGTPDEEETKEETPNPITVGQIIQDDVKGEQPQQSVEVIDNPAERTKQSSDPVGIKKPSIVKSNPKTDQDTNPAEEVSLPDPVDYRTEYSDVYEKIDQMAITSEQAEEAKRYADKVFEDPTLDEKSYNALTLGPEKKKLACISGLLKTANRHLGYKEPTSDKNSDKLKFDSGVASQTRTPGSISAKLVMPEGFGLQKNASIWNTPVITDFGFPFLNFSSDAMLNILKSKETDGVKNDNLKKMFKDASKRFGGVWKAIYSAPLELIKSIASDRGIQCTPNYIKVNGQDMLNSMSGENVSVIPIKYYSVDPAYHPAVTVPRDFLTTFYTVIDYSSTSKSLYLKYAEGLSADEFAEEIEENEGIPPFYLLVPKTAKFSKCPIRPGSLLGSLMSVILGRKKCTMVKTTFMGKRGCLAMESSTADLLYSDI